MNNLKFGISGIPHGERKMKYPEGIDFLKKFGLDAMELPFVRSVNVTDNNREEILLMKKTHDFFLSAHGSYFINLNAEDRERKKPRKKGF